MNRTRKYAALGLACLLAAAAPVSVMAAARTITCAACAALCGSLVCGLADYLWNYPRVMCIFWFVFAVALGGAKLCMENP